MCCHLPLLPTLGGAKVYLEATIVYRNLGHNVDLIGIDDIVGKEEPFLDESWRIANYPIKLHQYILECSSKYDVIEFESIYLPFHKLKDLKTILVARSVLLDLHMKEITIPRFSGIKSLAGFIFKGLQRKIKLNKKIEQSLITMQFADFINVPNPSDKEILIKYGISAEKIIVHPYGIFESRFKEFQEAKIKRPEKLKRKVIAFVGTFDNRKGAVEFPEIIKKILINFPDVDFKLLGVLGMFSTEASIQQYIGEEFKERVFIQGKYAPDELPDLLADCSFGIFPSYLESFGFGVLEMMAMGLPVVGYDSPGINMLLLQELMVHAGDVDSLIANFSNLITNDVYARECSTKCVLVANSFIYEKQENFSITSYLNKIQEGILK